MKDASKTNQELIKEISVLKQRIQELEQLESERKLVEEALEKRLAALTRPMEDSEDIDFEELFNLDDIQRLQDEFARATGVASIITLPDGTPITAPSSFCRLCSDIIRKTEKGCANCYKSDAVIGRLYLQGPTIQRCMSGGLWDAGAGISVGGRHIANWLIGQVRDSTQTEEKMRAYAREIGADEASVVEAFREVPAMSREQFERVAQVLFTLANQLSSTAYQNVQQVRFITESKQAEEALVSERTMIRTIIDSLPDRIYVKDLDRRFKLNNAAHITALGVASGADALGRTDHDFRPPERADRYAADDRDVMQSGRPLYNREEVTVLPSGKKGWLLSSKMPLRDAKGKIIGLVGISRDITDRKQAEEALRESEEKYRWVLNNMADVITVMDMNLRFTYVSPSIMRMRGYTAEEATAQTFEQVMTPQSLQISAKVFDEEMKLEASGTADPGRIRILEVEQYRKDGSIVLMENSLSFMRDMAQKPVGIISVSRDITDRKRAEEALKESENKYRLLADNVNDVIFVLDMNFNFTYVSPSIKILMGYEPEELLKQPAIETMTPSSWDLAMKTISEVIGLEKFEHSEILTSRTVHLEMRRKDGTTVWTEVKASFIRDENQRTVGILGVTRDITDRKRVEEALKESENKYRELSIIDGLTQLYNSRHFYVQLKNELDRSNRYGQPLTLLLLDLDDFKQFNDAYGHVEGDQVLMRLGQVVKRCLRETDFAYRYGGEEFTILLPMTTSADGAVTAERIRTEFKKENFSPVPGQDVHLTVSTGLAQYKPQEDMKAFVHRVDQLMYQAKKNGKDRVCCES